MGSLDKKKNYKKIAKEVIDLEIKALKKLKTSINSSFNEAIEAITNCQSKVILCGVGKSGLIAAKISATLSSVGTPSFSYLLMIVLMVILAVYPKKMFLS